MQSSVRSVIKIITLVLVGIVFSGVVLEAGLRIGQALDSYYNETVTRKKLLKKGVVRILCLGDSMTAKGYPAYLEKLLNARSTGLQFALIDGGVGGINTKTILEDLDANLDRYKPDAVIVMMGMTFFSDEVFPYRETFLGNVRLVRLIVALRMQIQRARQSRSRDNDDGLLTFVPVDTREGILFPKRNDVYKNVPRDVQYYLKRDPGKAEALLRRAMKEHPEDANLFIALSEVYHDQDKPGELRQLFAEAVALHGDNIDLLKSAGVYYRKTRDFAQAERLLKKALELDSGDGDLYLLLACTYADQKKVAEAENLLQRSIRSTALNDRLYRYLAVVNLAADNYAEADRYFARAEEISLHNINPETYRDYRRLAKKLFSRNIRLICMQYPMRSTRPLKQMLRGFEGIVFIDNEAIFKNALKHGSYDDYFYDQYGGDFGHLTAKGMELMGRNAAEKIIGELAG